MNKTKYARFWLDCLKDAWAGSLDIANAWSGLWGPALVWIILWWLGLQLKLPDQLDVHAILFAFLLFASTWVAFMIVRLVGAPARLYARLQETIPPVSISDMSLTLRDGVAYEAGLVDVDGHELPRSKGFVVRATNIGDELLQKCQISYGLKELYSYPVTNQFDLRPGEYKDVIVLRVNFENDDPRAFVYYLRNSDWKIQSNGPSWITAPGIYEVRALSADTHPALLNVRLLAFPPLPDPPPREWKLITC